MSDMTATDHYNEAVRLLGLMTRPDTNEYFGDHPSTPDAGDPDQEALEIFGVGNLAAAQVHATLAVACTLAAALAPLAEAAARGDIARRN